MVRLGCRGEREAVAWSTSANLEVATVMLWDSSALAVLHLAFARKLSAFDSRPCLGALCAPGAFPVAARAENCVGGSLGIVGPIAVLCLAPLAGAFLQGLRDGLLIVARYAHSYRNHPIKL